MKCNILNNSTENLECINVFIDQFVNEYQLDHTDRILEDQTI